jgi:hypothetical protein
LAESEKAVEVEKAELKREGDLAKAAERMLRAMGKGGQGKGEEKEK